MQKYYSDEVTKFKTNITKSPNQLTTLLKSFLKTKDAFEIDKNQCTSLMYLVENKCCTADILKIFLQHERLNNQTISKKNYINAHEKFTKSVWYFLLNNKALSHQTKEACILLLLEHGLTFKIIKHQTKPFEYFGIGASDTLVREIAFNYLSQVSLEDFCSTVFTKCKAQRFVDYRNTLNIDFIEHLCSHPEFSNLAIEIFLENDQSKIIKDINEQDSKGNSPLHYIIKNENIKIEDKEKMVCKIINLGANIELVNEKNEVICNLFNDKLLNKVLMSDQLDLEHRDNIIEQIYNVMVSQDTELKILFIVMYGKFEKFKQKVDAFLNTQFEEDKFSTKFLSLVIHAALIKPSLNLALPDLGNIFLNESKKEFPDKKLITALLNSKKINNQSEIINELAINYLKAEDDNKLFIIALLETQQITNIEILQKLFEKECNSKTPSNKILTILLKTPEIHPDSCTIANNQTLMFHAIKTKDADFLQLLLNKGASLNHKDNNNETVKQFLEKNFPMQSNDTALEKIHILLSVKNQFKHPVSYDDVLDFIRKQSYEQLLDLEQEPIKIHLEFLFKGVIEQRDVNPQRVLCAIFSHLDFEFTKNKAVIEWLEIYYNLEKMVVEKIQHELNSFNHGLKTLKNHYIHQMTSVGFKYIEYAKLFNKVTSENCQKFRDIATYIYDESLKLFEDVYIIPGYLTKKHEKDTQKDQKIFELFRNLYLTFYCVQSSSKQLVVQLCEKNEYKQAQINYDEVIKDMSIGAEYLKEKKKLIGNYAANKKDLTTKVEEMENNLKSVLGLNEFYLFAEKLKKYTQDPITENKNLVSEIEENIPYALKKLSSGDNVCLDEIGSMTASWLNEFKKEVIFNKEENLASLLKGIALSICYQIDTENGLNEITNFKKIWNTFKNNFLQITIENIKPIVNFIDTLFGSIDSIDKQGELNTLMNWKWNHKIENASEWEPLLNNLFLCLATKILYSLKDVHEYFNNYVDILENILKEYANRKDLPHFYKETIAKNTIQVFLKITNSKFLNRNDRIIIKKIVSINENIYKTFAINLLEYNEEDYLTLREFCSKDQSNEIIQIQKKERKEIKERLKNKVSSRSATATPLENQKINHPTKKKKSIEFIHHKNIYSSIVKYEDLIDKDKKCSNEYNSEEYNKLIKKINEIIRNFQTDNERSKFSIQLLGYYICYIEFIRIKHQAKIKLQNLAQSIELSNLIDLTNNLKEDLQKLTSNLINIYKNVENLHEEHELLRENNTSLLLNSIDNLLLNHEKLAEQLSFFELDEANTIMSNTNNREFSIIERMQIFDTARYTLQRNSLINWENKQILLKIFDRAISEISSNFSSSSSKYAEIDLSPVMELVFYPTEKHITIAKDDQNKTKCNQLENQFMLKDLIELLTNDNPYKFSHNLEEAYSTINTTFLNNPLQNNLEITLEELRLGIMQLALEYYLGKSTFIDTANKFYLFLDPSPNSFHSLSDTEKTLLNDLLSYAFNCDKILKNEGLQVYNELRCKLNEDKYLSYLEILSYFQSISFILPNLFSQLAQLRECLEFNNNHIDYIFSEWQEFKQYQQVHIVTAACIILLQILKSIRHHLDNNILSTYFDLVSSVNNNIQKFYFYLISQARDCGYNEFNNYQYQSIAQSLFRLKYWLQEALIKHQDIIKERIPNSDQIDEIENGNGNSHQLNITTSEILSNIDQNIISENKETVDIHELQKTEIFQGQQNLDIKTMPTKETTREYNKPMTLKYPIEVKFPSNFFKSNQNIIVHNPKPQPLNKQTILEKKPIQHSLKIQQPPRPKFKKSQGLRIMVLRKLHLENQRNKLTLIENNEISRPEKKILAKSSHRNTRKYKKLPPVENKKFYPNPSPRRLLTRNTETFASQIKLNELSKKGNLSPKKFKHALNLYNSIINKNIIVHTTMLKLFLKCNPFDTKTFNQAWEFYKKLEDKTIVTHNTMLNVFSKIEPLENKEFQQAWNLYKNIKDNDKTIVTQNTMLNLFAKLESLDKEQFNQACGIYENIKDSDIDIITHTTMLNVIAKNKAPDFGLAHQIFEKALKEVGSDSDKMVLYGFYLNILAKNQNTKEHDKQAFSLLTDIQFHLPNIKNDCIDLHPKPSPNGVIPFSYGIIYFWLKKELLELKNKDSFKTTIIHGKGDYILKQAIEEVMNIEEIKKYFSSQADNNNPGRCFIQSNSLEVNHSLSQLGNNSQSEIEGLTSYRGSLFSTLQQKNPPIQEERKTEDFNNPNKETVIQIDNLEPEKIVTNKW